MHPLRRITLRCSGSRNVFSLCALLLFTSLTGCTKGSAGSGGTDAPSDGGSPTADGGTASDGGTSNPGSCEAQTYFNETAWPQVFTKCSACHVAGGVSAGTRFVLKPATATGALKLNFGIVAKAARELTQDGQPLLDLKPTNQVPHGGNTVIVPGSSDENVLKAMLEKLGNEQATMGCNTTGPGPVTEGVTLLTPRATLRKAALQVAGRLPTLDEYAAVEEGDADTLSGLDDVLLDMMTEEGFYEHLKEMFNDVLMTDSTRIESKTYSFLAGSSIPRSLMALQYCEDVNWQNYDERTNTPESRLCLSATEALTREPLEMIAHVVRENRPFTEILTGQYRYLNIDAAKVFGIDLTPFAGHESDSKFLAEVRIPTMHGPGGLPEEYAGVVTTNAYLYRYNSTSTNRNRGRSYYFYKYFLGKDVMKSSARLDLSQVDFHSNPWKNNPQCTSCHSSIDPVAGAFQHWTDCYDNREVQYFSTRYCGDSHVGWFPATDMFPPGVGPGDENTLTTQQLSTALAYLAQHAVQDPGFATAMASHVFIGLTNQDLLDAPKDPDDPNYEALDAAYEAQKATIEQLGKDFATNSFSLKKLVIAIVKTQAFRAATADKADRLELLGQGGGNLTTPETLHRKVAAVMGAPWSSKAATTDPKPSMQDPPYNLLSPQRFRLFAGGIDSINIRHRARIPGSITNSVLNRLALEMSCEYTAYDFAIDKATRQLFPLVDRTLVPSGDAMAANQEPILKNLQYLHERILGEQLELNDPELLETYKLLVQLQQKGVLAIGMGQASSKLTTECAAKVHFASGTTLPANQQFSDDATYVVRAWQGVLAYMLMDYRFGFEE